jgi:hypothetical protein
MAMEISNIFKHILRTRLINAVRGNSNAVKCPRLNYAENADPTDPNITVTTAAHNFISFHANKSQIRLLLPQKQKYHEDYRFTHESNMHIPLGNCSLSKPLA